MTSRDRVIRTLRHEPVDRAPRDLRVAAAVESSRADEVAELLFRYPGDTAPPEFRYPRGLRAGGARHAPGGYTDAWGCGWRVAERGAAAELALAPAAEADAMEAYRSPLELLESPDLAGVNRSCAATSRFVLASTRTRPFDRLQFVRGPAAALSDLLHNTQPIRRLLARIHEFSLREMEMWASTDVDGVAFRDDWGSPDGLLLPLDLWDETFKPLYHQYCQILHARDKFVFFRSAGRIDAILDELIEIGVDAVQAAWSEADGETLARQYRGRITFWGGCAGPQLADGTPAAIHAAVHRFRTAMDFGRGGLIAQCPWRVGMPLEHLAAFFEAWQAPVAAHAHAPTAATRISRAG